MQFVSWDRCGAWLNRFLSYFYSKSKSIQGSKPEKRVPYITHAQEQMVHLQVLNPQEKSLVLYSSDYIVGH